jgi:hypothetical protein
MDDPGVLAGAIDPENVQTPALDGIDDAIAWAYLTPGARLAISIAPQEGSDGATTLRHYADPVSEVDWRAAAYLAQLTARSSTDSG